MDFPNYYEIILGFYEALYKENCESPVIVLKELYPNLIHLTSNANPEPMNSINVDLSINLTCDYDPIAGAKVKYWEAFVQN